MANTGHMDDDHSHGRKPADIFGSPGRTLHLREADEAADPSSGDVSSDAEARMRQALGLFGTRPNAGTERAHHEHQGADRRTPQGGPGARRHRFVQDGEVPVSVVRGRAPQRAGAPEPDRHAEELAQLRQTAADLERKLHEREIQLRSLQTRIGHAELERDAAIAEARDWRAKALQAENAATTAQAVVQPAEAPLEAVEVPAQPSAQAEEQQRAARRLRKRGDEAQLEFAEPEPVKWWL